MAMKVRIVHVAHTMSRILSEDNGRHRNMSFSPTHTVQCRLVAVVWSQDIQTASRHHVAGAL